MLSCANLRWIWSNTYCSGSRCKNVKKHFHYSVLWPQWQKYRSVLSVVWNSTESTWPSDITLSTRITHAQKNLKQVLPLHHHKLKMKTVSHHNETQSSNQNIKQNLFSLLLFKKYLQNSVYFILKRHRFHLSIHVSTTETTSTNSKSKCITSVHNHLLHVPVLLSGGGGGREHVYLIHPHFKKT